jgi:hypothetical protein
VIPLPTLDATPPVTKIYFTITFLPPFVKTQNVKRKAS